MSEGQSLEKLLLDNNIDPADVIFIVNYMKKEKMSPQLAMRRIKAFEKLKEKLEEKTNAEKLKNEHLVNELEKKGAEVEELKKRLKEANDRLESLGEEVKRYSEEKVTLESKSELLDSEVEALRQQLMLMAQETTSLSEEDFDDLQNSVTRSVTTIINGLKLIMAEHENLMDFFLPLIDELSLALSDPENYNFDPDDFKEAIKEFIDLLESKISSQESKEHEIPSSSPVVSKPVESGAPSPAPVASKPVESGAPSPTPVASKPVESGAPSPAPVSPKPMERSTSASSSEVDQMKKEDGSKEDTPITEGWIKPSEFLARRRKIEANKPKPISPVPEEEDEKSTEPEIKEKPIKKEPAPISVSKSTFSKIGSEIEEEEEKVEEEAKKVEEEPKTVSKPKRTPVKKETPKVDENTKKVLTLFAEFIDEATSTKNFHDRISSVCDMDEAYEVLGSIGLSKIYGYIGKPLDKKKEVVDLLKKWASEGVPR